MLFKVRDVDRAWYETHLVNWLPARMVDIHAHIWLKSDPAAAGPAAEKRGASWPERVADQNPIEDLLETYRLMFPQQTVMPLVFGMPRRDINLDAANEYVSRSARQHSLPALLVSTPEWPADELERRVKEGRFLGLKPYLCFAPAHLSENEITIFDFLPHAHSQVADQHGWLVMLHIPRKDRLRDPLNLQHLIEIERQYPNIRLIVAHIGRAYCQPDVGNAFEILKDTERMWFDFSANTNAWVMEQAIKAVGPKRILFGSDLPILRMRMRRICENGAYVNLVPPGLYGDVQGDPHMREVSAEEGQRLTFFMYEELLAFRRAAEATNLTATDLADVFYHNAARLVQDVDKRS